MSGGIQRAEQCLKRALSCILGNGVELVPVSGGCISRTAAVRIPSGLAAFVKWSDETSAHLPGLFAAEANGLARLREANAALRVPQIIACHEEDEAGSEEAPPPFLLMEYIEQTPPGDPMAFATRFGRALARMHRENPAPEETFGLERDNYIGLMTQKNRPRSPRWWEFYRDCRILPQVEIARQRGYLPPARERLLMGLIDCLENALGDMPDGPCLLHGDLWSGNFLCSGGGNEPVLIDPSVYYGPREMEIAYIELFGGFPPGFLEAYRDEYPLDAGYSSRRPLHQLYPLINHLNHFGEAYGPRVEQVCRQYAA